MRQEAKGVPKGAIVGSRIRSIAATAICAIALSGALVAQASAVTRIVTARFGPDGTAATQFGANAPKAIAINQATKRIYVLESNTSASKIYAFDVTTPGVFTPAGGNFPLTVPASPASGKLAVDNTALSSAGNLYFLTTSTGDPHIYGYTAAGVPLGGGFPITMPEEAGGLAVDATGQIWVVGRTAPTRLRHFDSAGVEGTPVDISNELLGSYSGASAAKLAFDANNDLYLTGTSAGAALYKLTAASGYATKAALSGAGQPPTIQGLAVDPLTHNLYDSREAAGNRHLEARDSSGALLYEFGGFVDDTTTTTQAYQGLAVDASRDEVYVAESTRFRRVLVFSPPGSLPAVSTAAESGLTGTHATLNGTVNPEGGVIGECKFEYLTLAAYEGNGNSFSGANTPSSKACEGSIPTDNSPHPVSAALSNLKPQGTAYRYRLVAKNGFGSAEAQKTFITADTYLTGAASPIGVTTATLNGTVNPDGVALTDCEFEYGLTTDYGSTTPCNPTAGSIPADGVPHPVSADLTGLAGNTTYHFRISASSALGTFVGTDRTFATLGVPQIVTQAVSPPEQSSVTLYAEVNPRGFNTNYRFEYGKTAAYGSQAPADFELFAGSGTVPVKASVKLGGLQEGSTYHYRVVAVNSAGTSNGPDQTFTTRVDPATCPNAAIRAAQVSASQPEGSTPLPFCMALEMVSPPQKGQQPIQIASIAADGEHLLFHTTATLAGTEATDVGGVDYIASRGSDGWTTTPTRLRQLVGGDPPAYAPDLSAWLQFGAESDRQNAESINRGFISSLAGKTTLPTSPLLIPVEEPATGGVFAGASGDLTHLFIRPRSDSLVPATFSARYLPGDPQPAPVATARENVYVSSRSEEGTPEPLQLLARDSLGKAWGGNCGVQVGGDLDPSKAQGNADEFVRAQGAISQDGSRVYFSTRPSQPPSGPCDTANKIRILERNETAGGPEITELVQNECTRVSPACSPASGDDNFQGASSDGNKVYFTTTRQLVNSDLDTGSSCNPPSGPTGCDLYLYEKLPGGGHDLVQVSAGAPSDPTPGSGAGIRNGVVAVSTDGSHVYFVAEGILTEEPNALGLRAEKGKPNLYLYERDEANPTGRTAFVGALASTDAGELWGESDAFGGGAAYAVPAMSADGKTIGGDGHVLVFESNASLTGNDTDNGHRDVYRYDSSTGSIQCISCLAEGSSVPDDVRGFAGGGSFGSVAGPQFASLKRWVSESGDAIVFPTPEALLPEDTNGVSDDYLWRDGQLQRLPGSEQTPGLPERPTISADGFSVAFRSGHPLLPQDGDTVVDAYVLRAGGGFPIPPPEVRCSGESCQEPFRGQPSVSQPATESAGGGNVVERPPTVKCKKGFVRRKGRCVKRRARKRHHRHQHQNRAAGNRQGGLK